MRAAAVSLLAAAVLWGQPPAIRSGGVVNAAGRVPSVLPGGAIARGALFEIAGVCLGTSAQTTAVTVSARGAGVRVPLLAVSPQRIEGRMPEGAPLGDVSLAVTVNGMASPPYRLQVVRTNFGIYSRNQAGWGPGRVESQAADGSRSDNNLRDSVQPGQSLVLYGTGLGESHPEVWVGFRRAAVEAVRRGAAGKPDEIAIRIPPDTPDGCYVPLQVRGPGAAASNTVTVSVHAGGGPCLPPPILPVAVWRGRTAGLVVLSRTVSKPDSTTDDGAAVFVSHGGQEPVLSPILLVPPLGTCATYTAAMASGPQPAPSLAGGLMSSAEVSGLNAGPRISVARNRLRVPISPLAGAPGVYKRLLGEKRTDRPARNGPLFFEPGNLVVSGPGGVDIGPFAVSLPPPEPLFWENLDSLYAVDRRAGVTFRWRPAAAEGAVLIGLVSVDQMGLAWGACYCAADGAAGSFTLPSAVLSSLPASQAAPGVPAPTVWLSYLPFRNQQPFDARGLDHGLAVSLFVETREVVVR